MKVFFNRKFAVLICVLVVVLATLLGVRGSLSRLSRDAEAMFYDGVYLKDEGYVQPGIDSHLNKRMDEALNFATLMEGYPELAGDTEALLSARRALKDAASIKGKYSENEKLQRTFLAVADKAMGLRLSEGDRAEVERCLSSFSGAQTAIQNSRYNQQAKSYADSASFLVRIIKPFLFVSSPQTFA